MPNTHRGWSALLAEQRRRHVNVGEVRRVACFVHQGGEGRETGAHHVGVCKRREVRHRRLPAPVGLPPRWGASGREAETWVK